MQKWQPGETASEADWGLASQREPLIRLLAQQRFLLAGHLVPQFLKVQFSDDENRRCAHRPNCYPIFVAPVGLSPNRQLSISNFRIAGHTAITRRLGTKICFVAMIWVEGTGYGLSSLRLEEDSDV
jgi:hypothetical protein